MAELTLSQAKLRAIEALAKAKKSLGKLEIAHASEVPLGNIKDALEELVGSGLVKAQEGDKFSLLDIKDSDSEFAIVTEVILDTLDLLGPLPPRDLADCVKDVLGEDLGPGKIQGIAAAVSGSKSTRLRRRSVGGGGASKWGRDFYYLLEQTDELGMRLRLYESSKLREQWRTRIKGKMTGAGAEGEAGEGADFYGGDIDVSAPVGEGPEPPFPNFDKFLEHLKGLENYSGQIQHVERIKKREALFGELSKDAKLDKTIETALKEQGIWPLYTHQVETINALAAGQNVVIATPNASGKTLCYTVPIFDAIMKDPKAKALYITPTKALEQDQLKRFRKFYITLKHEPSAETYDGDTLEDRRKQIKAHFPSIILTNPDELHYGILPFHDGWADFLRNLKFVAIDEVHTYQGVFGSHVANIMRRLRRICKLYRANPVFVCASATIANPKEFAEKLVGIPFRVIDNNGAPQGPKHFVFWDPPMDDSGERRSPYTEAVWLFKEHVKHNIKNITFTKARRIAELILRWSKNDLTAELIEKISSYRAGYTPLERRSIEKGLSSGNLIGVTATNALELGIDIGDLDATILVGYPGTIASTWQQANRAGRGEAEALITMIALHDPLDQFFMKHPEYFFGRSSENAVIDPQNEYILKEHLGPAALEIPMDDKDAVEYFGPKAPTLMKELERDGMVTKDRALAAGTDKKGKGRRKAKAPPPVKEGDFWYCTKTRPHRYVSIRTASRDSFQIIDVSRRGDRVIGLADRARAFTENHKGAIYIHQGNTFYVRDLDLAEHKVYVEPIEADYYTEPLMAVNIRVLEEGLSKELGDGKYCSVHYGRVEVREEMKGFVQVREGGEADGEVMSKEGLNLPPTILETSAFWLKVDPSVREALEDKKLSFEGGLHGIEHVANAMLPLYAICDRRDLGGETHMTHNQLDRPGIFIYDNSPGGVGLTEKGYENIDALLRTVLDAIRNCPCESGCPSCIHSPYCGKRNEGLDKAGAIEILEMITGSRPKIGKK
jgi:DEAD/DEAH box helicase domain-containing protein